MSFCASCGSSLSGDVDLCPHHHTGQPDDWAQTNRLMCDFLHRKWIPPSMETPDEVDETWAEMGEPVEEPAVVAGAAS
jgi:hypothetical protein